MRREVDALLESGFATKFGVAMSHPLVGLIARLEQAIIRVADAVVSDRTDADGHRSELPRTDRT